MERDIKPPKLRLVSWPVVGEPAEPAGPVVADLEVARRRRAMRLVPTPLAYCRPENDQGQQR